MSPEILILGALGAAAVVVVLVLANRQTTRLYEEVLKFLDSGELVKFGPLVTRVRGVWKSRKVEIWKTEGSDKSPSYLYVEMSGGSPVRLSLSPEVATHRMIKKLGWSGLEVEIGDPELDEAFLIRTEDPREAGRILTHPAVRSTVLELLENRFHSLEWTPESFKARRTNYEKSDFEPEHMKPLLDQFHLLMQVAEGSGPSAAPSFPPRAQEEGATPQAEPGWARGGGSAGAQRDWSEPKGYRPLEPGGGRGNRAVIVVLILLAGLLAWGLLAWWSS